MFICEKCHEKDGCPMVHFFESVGPCEVCNVRSVCWDCKGEPKEQEPVRK